MTLTLKEALRRLDAGEPVPLESLNGHGPLFALLNKELGTRGLEAVRRTIENKAKYEKGALAQAWKEIKAEKNSAPTPAQTSDDLEDFPELPPHLVITPPAFPLKEKYMAYSKAISPEGYEDFHATCFWVLLSIIAARRIVVNLTKRVYTAIMVTLVARTTLVAKTTTTDALRYVLKTCDLDWLLGPRKPTPQKLVADMSGKIPENYDEEDEETQYRICRRLATSGQRGWIYPEVGKLIATVQKQGSYLSELNDLLLQFADNQEDLGQDTIGRGTENIERPYLTFLGSMTPASIKANARTGAEIWNDGLFGRMIFSCPPGHLILDEPWGLEFVPVPKDLIDMLKNWHERLVEPAVEITSEKIQGKKRFAMKWIRTPQLKTLSMEKDAHQAWKEYRSWLKKTVATFPSMTDFDATYGRLANTALAVAALAASVENSNTIQKDHWALGQAQAEEWRKGVHRFYTQVNSQERTADLIEKLLVTYLTSKGTQATIKDCRDHCRPLRRYRPEDVENTANYLVKQGVLSKKQVGKTVFYNLASRAEKHSTKEKGTKADESFEPF